LREAVEAPASAELAEQREAVEAAQALVSAELAEHRGAVEALGVADPAATLTPAQ
jgi:hypothetical protein